MGRIVTWIIGLALLSVVYAAAIRFQVDDIEFDLKDRSNLALIKYNISWANVVIDGRDAIIEGMAPNEESISQVKKSIMSVWGIRKVECRCPIRQGNETISERPSIETPERIDSGITPTTEKMVSEVSSQNTEPRSGNYNPTQQCQADIIKQLSENSIEFTSGSSRISPDSLPLLDELIKIIESCPNTKIKIAGHTDNVGLAEDNSALSLDRAEAVRNALQKAGVPQHRLRAVGYGDSSPIDNNNTEEGRKRNRRIEFQLTTP